MTNFELLNFYTVSLSAKASDLRPTLKQQSYLSSDARIDLIDFPKKKTSSRLSYQSLLAPLLDEKRGQHIEASPSFRELGTLFDWTSEL